MTDSNKANLTVKNVSPLFKYILYYKPVHSNVNSNEMSAKHARIKTHTFVTQHATLPAVIRHCITDIWNFPTQLQFPVNVATLEASFTRWDGGGNPL